MSDRGGRGRGRGRGSRGGRGGFGSNQNKNPSLAPGVELLIPGELYPALVTALPPTGPGTDYEDEAVELGCALAEACVALPYHLDCHPSTLRKIAHLINPDFFPPELRPLLLPRKSVTTPAAHPDSRSLHRKRHPNAEKTAHPITAAQLAEALAQFSDNDASSNNGGNSEDENDKAAAEGEDQENLGDYDDDDADEDGDYNAEQYFDDGDDGGGEGDDDDVTTSQYM